MIVLVASATLAQGTTEGSVTSSPPTITPTPGTEPLAAPPTQRAVQPTSCVLGLLRLIRPTMAQTLVSALNLTDEQKAKVVNLLTKAEEDAVPKVEAQRKAAQEFAIAVGKESTTQAEMMAAAEKAMKAEAELLNDKIRTLYALKAMLTDEQNTKLAAKLMSLSVPWLPRQMQLSMPRATGAAPPPVTTTTPTTPTDGNK